MSGITRLATGQSSENVTRLRFRRSVVNRPGEGALARQTQIALLAFQAFDDRNAARQFLNERSAEIDGRPIDLAGESDAGFATVRAMLPTGS
ncbi:MAG: DUF2384 domain-containing protein [Sphingomonas sp.]|nr:DUF2384 domain-containing protein [Sphingomonas sp.]